MAVEESSSRFWDLYAIAYDTVRNWLPYQRLLESIIEELALEPGMRLLDLGCGTGNLERRIADGDPEVAVVGLDFAEGMLRRARRKCATCGSTRFVQHDLSQALSFDDSSFDRVIVNNVLYALPDRRFALSEARRVLRRGGLLVLSDPREGASPRQLLLAHLREIAALPLGPRLLGYARSAVTLPATTLVMGGINTLVIIGRQHRGTYSFLSEDDLTSMFEGFEILRVREAYGDQNLLVVARKP